MKNERYIINKRKEIKLMKFNNNFSKLIIFLFLINIVLAKLVNRKTLFNYSEIHLDFKGKGSQNILYSSFSITPSVIYVNGKEYSPPKKTITLTEDRNNITLGFNTIKTCEKMFYNIENIIKVDLSNFDASIVTNMYYMFSGCISLEAVNFKNINTNSVGNMHGLFQKCSSLTSLDLSDLDTSNVVDMAYMFSSCSNLIYLDLSNFETSKVTDMNNMFNECTNLQYVNALSFDTSELKDMSYMFMKCSSLKYLDLSNFNTEKITTIFQMFYCCGSLSYINLKSSKMKSSVASTSAFYRIGPNCVVCTEDTFIINKFTSLTFNCDNDCFKENMKINDSENKCVESCLNKYEYNNICLDKCPKGTLLNDNICQNNKCLEYHKENIIDCKDDIPEGYYFDSNDQIYKKCFDTCKYCNGPGDNSNNNCIENNNNNNDDSNASNDSNSININTNTYVSEEESPDTNIYTDFYSTIEEITDNIKETILISEFKSSIPETNNNNNEDINDNSLFKIIKNILFNKTKGNNYLNISKEKDNDVLITIKNIIKNGFDIINSLNNGSNPSVSTETFNYTITSTINQKIYPNETDINIDLGKCEEILKEKYNICSNDSLYLLSVYGKLNNIPKIEYEVFYPFETNNFSTLDLSFCKNTKIEVSLPVYISIDDIDYYNKSSGFYNDICYRLTTEFYTDKSIKDRRKEYIDKHLSICEEDCDFTEYDLVTKKAKCSCFTKIKMPLISDIKVDKKKLISNFKDIRNIGNFKMLKCINLMFKYDNIFNNTANYILLFLLILSLIAIFIYIFHNKPKINEYIRLLSKTLNLNAKKGSQVVFNKINININIDNNKRKEISRKSDVVINNKNMEIINKKGKYKRKNKGKNKTMDKLITKKKENELDIKIKFDDIDLKIENIFAKYNDKEINSLDYNKAKKIDKRSYCQYYSSLLKTNHLFVFAFCHIYDYNSQIIKIYIFFYTYAINLFVSAIFYSDGTMHKIYIDKGSFDFTYQLPQMIYSFIISIILKSMLSLLGLYEKNIIIIKNNKKITNNSKIFFRIKCKISFFFIITYILLFLMWIYLGCFCAVYKNTQIHLIKNVTISFAISLITPFFICLLPGFFRMPSLKEKSKDSFLYKFSKFLQLF